MPQFLVSPSDVDPGEATAVLRGEESRHLVRALRFRPGDPVIVFDGEGRRWRGRFAAGDVREVRIRDLAPLAANESALAVELIQAIPKGERWDWILEKGTELGASGFRPVYTERSVPRIPEPRLAQRLQRWRRRTLAATKQCERGSVPSVVAPLELADALARAGRPVEGEIRLVLTERLPADLPSFDEPPPRLVCLAAGPEGGWSVDECRAFSEAEFRSVGLGPRILRAETAAIVGLSLIQAYWGDLVDSRPAW